jgi:hypothetical protein
MSNRRRQFSSLHVLRDVMDCKKVNCALLFVLLFVSYRNQQFTFLAGRFAGYENVIQATRVSGDTVTVACEALTAYCANIDRISVMYFMEPVKRGCGWPIIIVPTTEDPLCRPAGGQMGTAGSGGRPLQYFVSFSVLVRLTL